MARVFHIDGAEYPIPTLASLNMDEAVVFYEHNGYPVEDLWSTPDTEEEATERLERLRHPAVVRTMLHVAYLRGNPEATRRHIDKVVGQVPLVMALSAFIGGDEEEADGRPLERTSEPSRSSTGSSLDAPPPSGSSSETSSATPDSGLLPTGTFG